MVFLPLAPLRVRSFLKRPKFGSLCVLSGAFSCVLVFCCFVNKHEFGFDEFSRNAAGGTGSRKVDGNCRSSLGNHSATRAVLQIPAKFTWLKRSNCLPNFFTKRSETSPEWPPVHHYRTGTLVFVHNQKSGGGTTKECLKTLLKSTSRGLPKIVGNINVRSFYSKLLGKDIDKGLQLPAYGGDSTFGLCEYSAKPCSHFTVLRDPYERVISAYNMCYYSKQMQCRVMNATETPINDWAVHQGSFFFRQLLAKHELFTGKYDVMIQQKLKLSSLQLDAMPPWWKNALFLDIVITDEVRQVVLDYVLENLETWFAVIGLTDEYETNFKLFQEAFGLPFYSTCGGMKEGEKYPYQRDGESSDRDEIVTRYKSQLQSDPKVRKALYYDLKIYEKAKDIFRRQVEKYEEINTKKNSKNPSH